MPTISHFFKHNRGLSILYLLAIAISIPLTVFLLQQQQQLHSHAATASFSQQIDMIGKIVGTRIPCDGSIQTIPWTCPQTGTETPTLFNAWPDTSSQGIEGADLGAITKYNGRMYMMLGDTWFTTTGEGSTTPVVYGLVPSTFQNGLTFTGSLNKGPDGPNGAINDGEQNRIASALFTINWQGSDYMFGQYMSDGYDGGSDHWYRYAHMIKFNTGSGQFDQYKPSTYYWNREDATDSNRYQVSFSQSSFIVDYPNNYVYMIGAVANRFGGVKLARIPINSFIDTNDSTPWSYYLGNNNWSGPTLDERSIDNSVVWIIPPKDPAFSLDKNYSVPGAYPAGKNECDYLTITEFSVIYNPYLQKYMLLNGTDGCSPQVVKFYTADSLTGPWSGEQVMTMPYTTSDPRWDYYGVYTTDAMLENGGQIMYFFASNFNHYGVYEYKVTFDTSTPTPTTTPSPTSTPTLTPACQIVDACITTSSNSCAPADGQGRNMTVSPGTPLYALILERNCSGTYTASWGNNPNNLSGPLCTVANVSGTNQVFSCGFTAPTNSSTTNTQYNVSMSLNGAQATGKFQVPLAPTPTPLPTITPTLRPTITSVLLIGDINGDGHVNVADLSIISDNFGLSGTSIINPRADINSDTHVNVVDLSILSDHFGL